ncbi:MAG: hypothetical protein PHH26_03020 [Candidatus Thermoplasmatota archaeon]|nr:hypothetical protein [Candidatus Thermoplasmatota archaeon]
MSAEQKTSPSALKPIIWAIFAVVLADFVFASIVFLAYYNILHLNFAFYLPLDRWLQLSLVIGIFCVLIEIVLLLTGGAAPTQKTAPRGITPNFPEPAAAKTEHKLKVRCAGCGNIFVVGDNDESAVCPNCNKPGKIMARTQ